MVESFGRGPFCLNTIGMGLAFILGIMTSEKAGFMKNLLLKPSSCMKFSQVLLLSFFTVSVLAQEKVKRAPASASVPDEEQIIAPKGEVALVDIWLKDDDAGVMASMRDRLQRWDEIDQYAKLWNLESTNLYETPDMDERRGMILGNILKYADKRLAGEIKNAEEGSTFHTVGKVEKAIKPQASVSVAKDFALKFKARPLTGKAMVELRNPYFQYETTIGLNGTVRTIASKEFKDIGLKAGSEFHLGDEKWIAFVDQELSQNVKARLSSTNNKPAFADSAADKKIEMMASFPVDF